MKVMLIYANRIKYPKDISLGLSYISAVLKQNGYQVEAIDTTFGISDNDVQKKVTSFRPELIGISSTSPNFSYAVHIGCKIREVTSVPIVLGGIHATIDPEGSLMHSCFDMVGIGECEHAMLQLANSVKQGERNHDIENIWFRDGEKIIKNPRSQLVVDLDELPMPDRGLYDYEHYLKEHNGTASFITERGCPFQCSHCEIPAINELNKGLGPIMRYHSVDRILEEIRMVIDNYDVRAIEFYDDTFTINRKRLREFCMRYPTEIDLPFTINARFNTLPEEFFNLLGEAGCVRIMYGLESGDPRIRNEILNRPMSDERMIEDSRWAHEAGIDVYTYNMIGIPGETLESVRKTIRLNRRIKADYVSAMIYNAYKGTRLYDICVEQGLLNPDEDARSYHYSSNINHPEFSKLQLLFLRTTFGFQVFITWRPFRAVIDLVDRTFTHLPKYTLVRTWLLNKVEKLLRHSRKRRK